jgi:DNA-binding response OmpR family regulator
VSRILVVEDSPDFLDTLQSCLDLEGHEVFIATRAAQAVALAGTLSPELMVLDLGLPDQDGYSVLQRVRERGLLFPVMILSARNLETDKVEGFRLGADDYLTQPFSVMEFLARVSALLRRSGWSAGTSAPLASAAAAAPLSDEELRERFGLTARQIAVTRLLSEGCSNAEIAQRLSVSYFTARNHTEQVLQKLGVPTRAAVGAIVYGKG